MFSTLYAIMYNQIQSTYIHQITKLDELPEISTPSIFITEIHMDLDHVYSSTMSLALCMGFTK